MLQHSFFNHEFISIYKFLNFLPLKSDEEKSEFFSNILDSLKCYDEETVAKQLGGLLLSRLTMLDQTARKDVIPFILKPKNGNYNYNSVHTIVCTHNFHSDIRLFARNSKFIYREIAEHRTIRIFQSKCVQRTCEVENNAVVCSKRQSDKNAIVDTFCNICPCVFT